MTVAPDGKHLEFPAASITSLHVNGHGGNDVVTLDETVPWLVTVSGGRGNDTLVGGSGSDSIDGGDGNDSIDGGSGNDTLFGGMGDDTLIGGAGSDSLAGSHGSDTYKFNTATTIENDVINEQAYPDTDTLDFSAMSAPLVIRLNNDTLASGGGRTVRIAQHGLAGNIENAIGGSGNDLIIGNQLHANVLRGGGGSDTLRGLDKNDTLYGDSGSDQLFGGNDDDTFFAADGETDTLDGGDGVDVLGSSDAGDVTINLP